MSLSTLFRRLPMRMAAGLAAATTVAVSSVALSGLPAQAAPGDPFDVQQAKIFIAQGSPTALSIATTDGSGTVTFNPEGPDAGLAYNAMGFDEASGYIYGIAMSGRSADGDVTEVAPGSLIRIGEDGVVTQVGEPGPFVAHVGTMFEGHLYITDGSTALTAIDVSTGLETAPRSQTLSSMPDVSDFTEHDGYFWSISTVGQMVRINPADGQIDKFNTPAVGARAVFGAAWTYGNGNLGFSKNTTGEVRQISVTDPASDSPTFALVALSDGPASGNNDGTAALGTPADLGIVKTGPATAVAGLPIEYTLTVTNNGPGSSGGHVVSDTLPAGLSNIESGDPECSVVDSTVTCVGGALVPDATQVYTITADVGAAVDGSLVNTASVLGNEEDPDPSNDTSTVTTEVEQPDPALTITKSADLNDGNGNGLADKGETIDYSFLVENTGNVDLTDVTVDDPMVTGLDPASADIDAGEDVTFKADPYTVTADDVEEGKVVNAATATGTDPFDGPVESNESTTTTETIGPDGGGGGGNGLLPDTGAPAWMMTALAAAAALLGAGAWLVRRRALPGRHSAV